jgi:hypothetical protein
MQATSFFQVHAAHAVELRGGEASIAKKYFRQATAF